MPFKILTGETAVLEQRHNQWVVGYFMRDDEGKESILTTSVCELKRWRYEGPIDYPPKIFEGENEFITVDGGAISITLKDPDSDLLKTEALKTGSYLMISGRAEKVVTVLEAPAWGLCLRWPSRP